MMTCTIIKKEKMWVLCIVSLGSMHWFVDWIVVMWALRSKVEADERELAGTLVK